MRRTDSLEKTLMLGEAEGRRRRGRQRIRWLDGITNPMGHDFEQALGVGDGQGGLACCSPWGRKESNTPEPLSAHSTDRPRNARQLEHKPGVLWRRVPEMDRGHSA